MCLGLAMGFIKEKGNKIRDGDEFKLVTKSGAYLYEAKPTPNGIVLVPLSEATPIGAVHESEMRKYLGRFQLLQEHPSFRIQRISNPVNFHCRQF